MTKKLTTYNSADPTLPIGHMVWVVAKWSDGAEGRLTSTGPIFEELSEAQAECIAAGPEAHLVRITKLDMSGKYEWVLCFSDGTPNPWICRDEEGNHGKKA